MNRILSSININRLHISTSQLFKLNVFIFLSAFCFVIACINGSIAINLSDFLSGEISDLTKIVLLEIRLPRVILAALVGASLGISGAALQGLFRNPLADPGLIGVSAGAALGATLVIVLGSKFLGSFMLGSFLLPLGAISGAMLVIMMLYLLTKGFGYQGVTYMLLVGIAVNAIAGVGICLLYTSPSPRD